MQLIAFASATAALLATAAADISITAFNGNSSCDAALPKARIFNRCPYEVYLWSVLKGDGCPESDGVVVEPGNFYQENFRTPDSGVGVSIKISKTTRCKGDDCVQLEYFLNQGLTADTAPYKGNYLDVSYVDCLGGDCPTKKEGFYLKSGNKIKVPMRECPVLSCSDATECATMAYINPNDEQTKSCDLTADLDFYMCGGEAPGDESSYEPVESSAAPAPSSTEAYEAPAPSSASEEAPAYSEEAPAYTQEAEVAAAEITPAPQAPNVKTVVTYVTEFEYVHAKRHAHGHRHQHFRA